MEIINPFLSFRGRLVMRGNRFSFLCFCFPFGTPTDGNVLPWLHDRGLGLDGELERARSHMDAAHPHVGIDDRESSSASSTSFEIVFWRASKGLFSHFCGARHEQYQ